MSLTGVLRNPASSRNRRGRPLAPWGDVPVEAPAVPDATEAAVAALLARDVRQIAVDGGDGTVRLVIDALLRLGAAGQVALVLLPRGNTNLFAREIGGWRSALPAEKAGHVITRRVLAVRLGGRERHGLILGLGAYERATRVAIGGDGPIGAAGIASAVGGALWRAFLDGPAGPWRRGVPLSVALDDAAPVSGRRFLFIATAARGSLPLGIRPFWGDGGDGIRWLDIAAPAHRLATAAPFVLSGRPRRWMAAAGYRSGRAARIGLGEARSLVIDGDIVDAGRDGEVEIGLSPPIRFLVPEEAARREAVAAPETAEGGGTG
ncbi:MAG: diacylglycerol kinase family protein [Pseudomonadota bacterium]